MVVLVLNILILMFYALIVSLSSLNKSTQRFLFLTIAFLHLMFLHTFFDASLFPDLDNYYSYFSTISNPNINQPSIEIGWNILNRILYSISHNNFILLFMVSLIMILFYIITIKRYSAILWLSIFILLSTVFYNSLFVLRQHLAIPICLMTIPYIIERKSIKFSLLTLLAVSFHYSALIWFVAYFIYAFKLNKGFYVMLIIFSILLYLYMTLVLDNLIFLTTKIMNYTTIKQSGGLGTLKGAAVDLSALILSLYSFGSLDRITGYNKLFFQLTSLSLLLTLVSYFGTSFTLFDRLNLYYSVSGIFLIPNALANIKNKKFHYILLIPVICVLYLFYLNAMVQYGYKFKF